MGAEQIQELVAGCLAFVHLDAVALVKSHEVRANVMRPPAIMFRSAP
jgi:hypothetical protein